MIRRRHRKHARRRPRSPVDRSMRAHIFENEQVVLVAHPGRLATLPKYILTLGLYTFWRRSDTSVLTNQRILVGAGIMRRREQSIPLTAVDDVSFARRGLNSYADVLFRDRRRVALRRIGPMTPHTARTFARETLQRL